VETPSFPFLSLSLSLLVLYLEYSTVRTVQLKQVVYMSDRLYVDPVTNSVREERALFSFSKKLGKTNGQFYRLGVLTYCRVLIETGNMSQTLLAEYKAISEKDQDYLERLMQERIAESNDHYNQACSIELPKPKMPEINWETIPDDQKIRVYTEQAFTRDERKHWINKYLTASDDERPDVLKQFSDEYVTRFRADPNRPFNKLDLGVIKRVLVGWAEAEGGF